MYRQEPAAPAAEKKQDYSDFAKLPEERQLVKIRQTIMDLHGINSGLFPYRIDSANRALLKSGSGVHVQVVEELERSKQEPESNLRGFIANTTLTSLDLSDCDVDSQIVPIIVSALNSRPDIQTLNLENSIFETRQQNILDPDAAESLAGLRHVKELNLNGNLAIGSDGAAALAKNTSFERLYMDRCGVSERGARKFLKNNTVVDLRISKTGTDPNKAEDRMTDVEKVVGEVNKWNRLYNEKNEQGKPRGQVISDGVRAFEGRVRKGFFPEQGSGQPPKTRR